MPARKLIDYASKTLTDADERNNIGLPFVPSIEGVWEKSDWDAEIEEQLITDHPLELYRRGAYNKVPYITGFNANEAMLFLRSTIYLEKKTTNNMISYIS